MTGFILSKHQVYDVGLTWVFEANFKLVVGWCFL